MRRRQPGFTILELALVVAMLGLAAGLAFPRLGVERLQREQLQRDARGICRLVQYAHRQAIAGGRQQVLVFHLDEKRCWVQPDTGDGKPPLDPSTPEQGQFGDATEIVSIDAPPGRRIGNDCIALRFSPQGWNDKARITLSNDKDKCVIEIDGLLGRCKTQAMGGNNDSR